MNSFQLTVPESSRKHFLNDGQADLTLKVGDKEYSVHREVLSNSSLVINALINGVKWEREDFFELNPKFVKPELVDDLLSFLYTGSISLTMKNAQSLLLASKYLFLEPLSSAAETFLVKHTFGENVFDLFLFAKEHSFQVLLEETSGWICKHFERLAGDSKLRLLSGENFEFLLKRLENRKCYPAVQKAIESLTSVPISLPVQTGDLICFDDKSYNFYCSGDDADQESRRYPELIYFYDTGSGAKTPLPAMLTPRHSAAVTVTGNRLYTVGGERKQTVYNSVEAYDLMSNTWQSLCPIPEARVYSTICSLPGYIYVAYGGYSKIYQYSIVDDTWKTLKEPKYMEDCQHLLTSGGELYAIGYLDTGSIERYDPLSDQWSVIARDLIYDGRDAVAHKGKIYLVSETNLITYSITSGCREELPLPAGIGPRVGLGENCLISVKGKLFLRPRIFDEKRTEKVSVFELDDQDEWQEMAESELKSVLYKTRVFSVDH